MPVPSFGKLLLSWDGARMQVDSQCPGEADMGLGSGSRVSTRVRPGAGTADLPARGECQQEGAAGTEDSCSWRGAPGTLATCMTPARAPSQPDSSYRNHRSPVTAFHFELSSSFACE